MIRGVSKIGFAVLLGMIGSSVGAQNVRAEPTPKLRVYQFSKIHAVKVGNLNAAVGSDFVVSGMVRMRNATTSSSFTGSAFAGIRVGAPAGAEETNQDKDVLPFKECYKMALLAAANPERWTFEMAVRKVSDTKRVFDDGPAQDTAVSFGDSTVLIGTVFFVNSGTDPYHCSLIVK